MAIERIPFGYLLIADNDIKAQVERRNKADPFRVRFCHTVLLA